MNLASSLKYSGEFRTRITNSFSLSSQFEYASYKQPKAIKIEGITGDMNYVSLSMLGSWTIQNLFFFNLGARKSSEYFFLMDGPSVNVSKFKVLDAMIDLSIRGVVFFGDIYLGYQYRHNISNEFNSSYGKLSIHGERLYAKCDLLRSGRFGISAYLDNVSASGKYDYQVVSKATMGYFILGW